MGISGVKILSIDQGDAQLLDEFRLDLRTGVAVRTGGQEGTHSSAISDRAPIELSGPAMEELGRITATAGIPFDPNRSEYSPSDGQVFLAALAALYGRGHRLDVEIEAN